MIKQADFLYTMHVLTAVTRQCATGRISLAVADFPPVQVAAYDSPHLRPLALRSCRTPLAPSRRSL